MKFLLRVWLWYAVNRVCSYSFVDALLLRRIIWHEKKPPKIHFLNKMYILYATVCAVVKASKLKFARIDRIISKLAFLCP